MSNMAICFGLNWKPTSMSFIHEYACREREGRERGERGEREG